MHAVTRLRKDRLLLPAPFHCLLVPDFLMLDYKSLFLPPMEQTPLICILYFRLLFPGNLFHMFIDKYTQKSVL